ncbi:hypothetical protein [uncultured Cellulomonas sp.]|uniref:hypothetical protein n=1 Tax=uncultured Cellulomonas sp. TaxID=189682 RepID=UPI0028E49992|nr:hypothetical protein [uncultured Cellulomonas sp.]
MSLHVSGGLLLTGPSARPLALPAALKPVLLEVADRLFHEALAARVAHHIDRVRLGLPGLVPAGSPASVLGALVRQVAVETVDAIRDDTARHRVLDLGVRVTILAHPEREDALLGIVHAERAELREAVQRLDGVEEYAYLAEESPRLAAQEWQERARVWSHALRNGRYADLGWTWSLFGRYPEQTLRCLAAPDTNTLIDVLPGENDRARYLAGALGNTRSAKDANALAADLSAARAALAPIGADDLA